MATERKLSRRGFLQAGGVLLVGLAGGGVFRAAQRGVFSVGQGTAYEPWATWQTEMGEGALSLVRAGILASNPHNSQPWLFRVSDTQIDVYADTTRQIGTIDPFLREMYTGVGCALENMLLAAQAEGYDAAITYMPDPDDSTYAARITLAQGTPVANPLYDAIPRRRTNRLAYDTTRPVPQDVIEGLDALNADPDVRVVWVTDRERMAEIATSIIAATEALNADEEQSTDSHKWWRGDWNTMQTNRDGLTPDASQPPALAQFIKLLPDADRATSDAAFLEQTRTRHVATAMGYGFIVVRDHMDNALRLRGGRLWQRIHLQGTIDGLGMQPLNQMPERADREAQLGLEPRFTDALAEIVADPGYHVLMPFRFGYPTEQPAAPGVRRTIDEVVI
jgi:nitroreductase